MSMSIDGRRHRRAVRSHTYWALWAIGRYGLTEAGVHWARGTGRNIARARQYERGHPERIMWARDARARREAWDRAVTARIGD